jgi:hypothetical protein
MKTIHKYIAATAILALSIGIGTLVWAQANNDGPVRQDGPVDRFLGLDCGTSGMKGQVITDLKANLAESQAAFMSIIDQGPSPDLLQKEKANLTGLYREAQRFRDTHQITYADGSSQAKPVDESTFVASRLEDFKHRLTVRAMEGLVILATPAAKSYLQQKSKDTKFAFRDLAAELVATMQ